MTDTDNSCTPEVNKALEYMKDLSLQDIQKIGSDIQHQLSQDVDQIAQKSMTIDCDEAGRTLAELTTATDTKMMQPKNRLIAKIINPVRNITRRYKSLEENLVTLSKNIYVAKDNLEQNLSDIEILLEASRKHFNSLTPYIEAIEIKIKELEALRDTKLNKEGNESLEVLQMTRIIDAYKRRQKDLGVSKVVAYQTVKECMLLNNSNQALAERMQYAIDNLIPLYKQQLIAAVAVRIQKDSTKIIKSMSTAVNNLMVDTARNISQNMDEIKEINEAPILDIDKLKQVEVALNRLIEEMKDQNTVNISKHNEFMKNVEKLTEHDLKMISNDITVSDEGTVSEVIGVEHGKE